MNMLVKQFSVFWNWVSNPPAFWFIYVWFWISFVSRYTHIEAECPFMTFEDLLNRLEDLVCDVVDRVLKSPAAQLLYDINPVRHRLIKCWSSFWWLINKITAIVMLHFKVHFWAFDHVIFISIWSRYCILINIFFHVVSPPELQTPQEAVQEDELHWSHRVAQRARRQEGRRLLLWVWRGDDWTRHTRPRIRISNTHTSFSKWVIDKGTLVMTHNFEQKPRIHFVSKSGSAWCRFSWR